MRIITIAALALCTVAGGARAEDAADLDVTPDWIRKPDGDEVRAVFPREAMRAGKDGRAIIGCQVAPQGTLEACQVLSEEPAGMGFGEAALLLAPSFILKPGMKDGRPVVSTVRIPINFDISGPISGWSIRKAPMVTEAVWDSAPSFADMTAAWPRKATAEFGHVSMRCGIKLDGPLQDCEVLTETPRGQGFGTAARTIVASKFRMRMSPESAKDVAAASINLPIRFFNPNSATPRGITKPRWITQLNPERVIEVYPETAAKAGVTSGRGVADCLVAADGKLTDCRPAPANPEGLGFSEAAVAVASVMQMNPWSDGGGPVDGVRIKLPITFNLAPEGAAAAPRP